MNTLHTYLPKVPALGSFTLGLCLLAPLAHAGGGDVFGTEGTPGQGSGSASGGFGGSGSGMVIGPRVPGIPALGGFYFGAGFGAFDTDYADSVDDGSVTMVNDGDTGTAFNFMMGYQFNDYFSVEGGFATSDDVDYEAVSDGSGDSWAAGPVSADFEADMWSLDLIGRYPVAPRWWLIARLGYLYWETKNTYNENGFISSESDSGSSVRVGLGLEYDPGRDNFTVYRFDLGFQHFGGDEDLDVFTAGASMIIAFP